MIGWKSLSLLISMGFCAAALAQPAAPGPAMPFESALPSALEWQPIVGGEQSLETRFGTLVLQRGSQCPQTREPILDTELILAGNRIATVGCTPDGDYYIVSFKNRFEHGETDLVLFGATAGGSGTPPQRLHLIVLAPGEEPVILMDPEFRSLDGTQRVASDGRELWLDLGFREGALKRGHFDGSTFAIDYVPIQRMPVRSASCDDAYRTLIDCLQRGRGRNYSGLTLSELLGLIGAFSTASHRSLQSLSHYPGFDGAGYVQMCASAISMGAMPKFDLFEATVCSSETATP
jgi:hypothetical protein